MAGMRALGRVTNVLTAGISGTLPSVTMGTIVASFKECSGIEVVAYNASGGAASLTVSAGTTAASALAASEAYTTANGFGQPSTMYTQLVGVTNASRAGTVAWAKQTTAWSTNTLPLGGAGSLTAVDFLCSEMADTYDYLAFSSTASVFLTAIQYDLTVQRTPANLSTPGT